MSAPKSGVKDRLVHEIGRAIKQAQIEWCSCGCVRACTGRWLVLALDAALLHGLKSLSRGYWMLVTHLLDKVSLTTINRLPYASSQLAKGRAWLCLCLNEGELENYLHVMTCHEKLLSTWYNSNALLRDSHRAHILLTLAAGLEHVRLNLPLEVPGWIQPAGSIESSSNNSMSSVSPSVNSGGSASLPSPAQELPNLVDLNCLEALEEHVYSVEYPQQPVLIKRRPKSKDKVEVVHFSSKVSRRRKKGALGGSHSLSLNLTKTPKGCIINDSNQSGAANSKTTETDQTRSRPDRAQKNNSDLSIDYVKESGQERCQEQNFSKSSTEGGIRTDKDGNITSQVVRREKSSSFVNASEKRVSFAEDEPNADFTSDEATAKTDDIRDLSDLRKLLVNLRERGVLPTTFAIDDLFSNIDGTEPVPSERAPPEGQEDPPLHQSTTSLNQSSSSSSKSEPKSIINNNTDDNDESNNNSSSPTISASPDVADDTVKSISEDTSTLNVKSYSNGSNASATGLKASIIGGFRWEELTEMGCKIMADGGDAFPILDAPDETEEKPEANTSDNEKFSFLSCEDKLNISQYSLEGSESCSNSSNRIKRRPHMLPLDPRVQEQVRLEKIKDLKAAASKVPLALKSQFSKRSPNLYIPIKINPADYTEENIQLTIQIEQGWSTVVPLGDSIDSRRACDISQTIFSLPNESLYKVFSVREGHSRGQSSGVQVILSTHCLYIISPATRITKPKQSLLYQDIHTIIVGGNDQWICILSSDDIKTDKMLKKTCFGSSGIQLEIGDQDTTHSLMSCLELAIRRHIMASTHLMPSSRSLPSHMNTSQSQTSLRITDSQRTDDETQGQLSILSESTSSLSEDSEEEDDSSYVSSIRESCENLSTGTMDDSRYCPSRTESSASGVEPTSMTEAPQSTRVWDGTAYDCLLPGVIVHPDWEISSLKSWLRAQLRLQREPVVVGSWLVDWEDGSSLGISDSIHGPMGPSKEGPLMYKPPGLLSTWRPAYFILKAGVLYQFNDSGERLPQMIVEVGKCVGCIRLPTFPRPHGFQLLRKGMTPLMLAASDELESSQWLQAFLTIINTGFCTADERKQVSCRIVLLESGILLAQQSDLFLSSIPKPSEISSDKNKKSNQESFIEVPTTTDLNSPSEEARKLLSPAVASLRDGNKHASLSTGMNRAGSVSSLPVSPVKKKYSIDRNLDLDGKFLSNLDVDSKRHNHNSKFVDCDTLTKDIMCSDETSHLSSVTSSSNLQRSLLDVNPIIHAKGELKVLTSSVLEHLVSVSLYPECPNVCLMEFECSEAGEISGDWALYFRSKCQLQEFLLSLHSIWESSNQDVFPQHLVKDTSIQQFLLEGSMISSRGWTTTM